MHSLSMTVLISKLQNVFLFDTLINEPQQPRRQPPVPFVANVSPSRNPAKTVVVAAAVLGSETAGVLVTQDFSTRGTRACRSAKHGHDP